MAGHSDHGNTPAAWTGVIIMIIGAGVGGYLTIQQQWLGIAAGLGIMLLGLVVGLVMRAMGLGKQPEAASPAAGRVSVPAQAKAAPSGAAAERKRAVAGK
ncbi:HGxxPAAW family protein [Streptomyces sp. 7-21]|jgi:hypothetical protein|uniref:HGxxPAAW family protein n=1 Tax=Streptomyces sp. 7-21 TaxID=2802283 RepID=UPI001F3856AA|nr:HGxxPAAW family protein [Streptomyces sp. 7-21]